MKLHYPLLLCVSALSLALFGCWHPSTRLPGSEELSNIDLYVGNGHTYDGEGHRLALDPATAEVLGSWLVKDKHAVYYVLNCAGNSCPTQLLPIDGADPATFTFLPAPSQQVDFNSPSEPRSYLFAADKGAVYNLTMYTTSSTIERIPIARYREQLGIC